MASAIASTETMTVPMMNAKNPNSPAMGRHVDESSREGSGAVDMTGRERAASTSAMPMTIAGTRSAGMMNSRFAYRSRILRRNGGEIPGVIPVTRSR